MSQFQEAQEQSASIGKLRELARRLDETGHSNMRGTHHSPKVSGYNRTIDERMSILEGNVSSYFQNTEQSVATLKQNLDAARESVDELVEVRRLTQRSCLQMNREKEEEIESMSRMKKLQAMSLAEQLQMELSARQSDVADSIEQEKRSFDRNIAIQQKKAQKMLVGLLSELTNQRKSRTRSVNELGRRLQSKIDQATGLMETETKVRVETYRKLQQMQLSTAQRLKSELARISKERRQGSDSLLRMLQDACDTLLY